MEQKKITKHSIIMDVEALEEESEMNKGLEKGHNIMTY